MEAADKDRKMDSRVGHLEQAVAVLQTTQNSMQETLDRVAANQDLFLEKLQEMNSHRPLSMRDSLSSIFSMLSIFSIIMVGLGYYIDSRATVKAEPAIKVAETLMKDGDYFLLKDRVSRLEREALKERQPKP